MSDKVKLPKEVAEAIESLRLCGFDNRIIIDYTERKFKEGKNIAEWVNHTDGRFEVLLQALVNGYEVEQTPEDKVREMFIQSVKEEQGLGDHQQHNWWRGRRMGIIDTLDILNIKIQGVNAE